jgi:acetyl-CoA carboxylase biotin carboxyl carrier protein
MPAPPAAAPAAPLPVAEPAGTPVKAPMVGTFYRSGAPGSKPFVEIGSQVKEGDVLCIIEAMKLMNEIVAEQAGTVTQALVENGQPVEYGQIMFIIE